jgi:hypothetical protein
MKKGLMVQLRWALVIGVFSLITACRSTGGNDEDALATDGETMGRMDREFSSGGVSEEALKSRKSSFDKKEYRTKNLSQQKEFRTKEAKYRKLWAGGDDKFSTKFWQKKDYGESRSQFEGKASALADDRATGSDKAFWASDKTARTKTFGQSDKVFATKAAHADGKAFWLSKREVSPSQLGRNAGPTANVMVAPEDKPGQLNVDAVRQLLGRPRAGSL